MTDLSNLTDDDKRSMLILLMEDIRGAFDFGAGERTHAVIALARDLDYERVERHAVAYAEHDGYRDGRHFRTDFGFGGYKDPPFPVTRLRSEASSALAAAVDELCEYPENRLDDEVSA